MSDFGQQPPYGGGQWQQPNGQQDQPGWGQQPPPAWGQQPPPAWGQQPPPAWGQQPPPGYGPGPYQGAPQYGPGSYPPPPPYGYYAPFGQPPGPVPQSHLARAIVGILFFWPLAIVAIVKATQVEPALMRGDWYGAKAASDSARTCANICIGIGIAWGCLVAFLFILVITQADGPTAVDLPAALAMVGR